MSVNPLTHKLPQNLALAVQAQLEDWKKNGKVKRLWQRDASLWTGGDESKWLGWLGIVDEQLARVDEVKKAAQDVKQSGFTHALLLGMGGSSLCPEVLARTFGKAKGFPEFHVLDSTDPAQIQGAEKKVDLKKTLCIVSSKSGTTLEPNLYKDYFFERLREKVGEQQVGSRFIAITDPGSHLEQVAKADKFRKTFFGVPSIGGRYSALSHFGIVPAAIMGVDVAKFLRNALRMVKACGPDAAADVHPGVILGAILGAAANQGCDKLTIVATPGIFDLGAWLEQLIAESTGKMGKGIIPVDREELGEPAVYADDRLFVYLRLATEPDKKQQAAIAALERAGQPVVRITLPNIYSLGQEFFRWEMATAVAGSILGIHPFDQPDVEASKIATRKLTSEYEATGKLPEEAPFLEAGGFRLYADPKNAAALAGGRTLAGVLRAHLGRLKARDYFAVLAYLTMNEPNENALQLIRHQVRDAKKAATCLGFGPRFLHSTGQAYKGGPNTGVFVQITCDDAVDFPVPGHKYTFGVVKAAQARGDFAVLAERERRALRIHTSKNVIKDLKRLDVALQQVLQ